MNPVTIICTITPEMVDRCTDEQIAELVCACNVLIGTCMYTLAGDRLRGAPH